MESECDVCRIWEVPHPRGCQRRYPIVLAREDGQPKGGHMFTAATVKNALDWFSTIVEYMERGYTACQALEVLEDCGGGNEGSLSYNLAMVMANAVAKVDHSMVRKA